MDIVMEFQDNFNSMDEMAKNMDKLPKGVMELIYNDAANYNILNL